MTSGIVTEQVKIFVQYWYERFKKRKNRLQTGLSR